MNGTFISVNMTGQLFLHRQCEAWLEHPCKSELLHFENRLCHAEMNVFLIWDDGTLKHAVPIRPLFRYASNTINREIVRMRWHKIDESSNDFGKHFSLHTWYEHVGFLKIAILKINYALRCSDNSQTRNELLAARHLRFQLTRTDVAPTNHPNDNCWNCQRQRSKVTKEGRKKG